MPGSAGARRKPILLLARSAQAAIAGSKARLGLGGGRRCEREMGQDIWLFIAGAATALASSLITAWVQHQLALRREDIAREQRAQDERRRQITLGGISDPTQVGRAIKKLRWYQEAPKEMPQHPTIWKYPSTRGTSASCGLLITGIACVILSAVIVWRVSPATVRSVGVIAAGAIVGVGLAMAARRLVSARRRSHR
jgi:hypothetical protein